jgi:hypothetical protein
MSGRFGGPPTLGVARGAASRRRTGVYPRQQMSGEPLDPDAVNEVRQIARAISGLLDRRVKLEPMDREMLASELAKVAYLAMREPDQPTEGPSR